MWKLTPSFPSKERNELTAARKPSAVDGTTINFSPFNWAVKALGQDARNQARKALVSPTPEIKMGVLLGRSPAVAQMVATLALKWCQLACRSEARTCRRTCALLLSQLRQRIQTGPNPWLWA